MNEDEDGGGDNDEDGGGCEVDYDEDEAREMYNRETFSRLLSLVGWVWECRRWECRFYKIFKIEKPALGVPAIKIF